ncbi:MAG: CocE/NonD family hydrolase, partial [Leifsonia flava]
MKHVYERNVPMTTRDGVTLRANIWRPLAGKAPTLLSRLPYNKEANPFAGGVNSSIACLLGFLNAGYAVVWQDVRGAYESDGTFEPKIHEIADG